MSISTSFSGHFWFSALKTLSETYDLFEMEFNFDEFLSQQLLLKSINTLTCNSSTKIPHCSSGLIKEALCFNYGAECEKNNYGEYFPYQTVMDEVGTSDEAIPHNLLSSLPFWAASAVYISQLERLTGQRIQDLSFSLFH
ncbi:hypothetical protein RhiirC2_784781 [Rhizophagus irregularis]|uniref:Uncharacterized protein n=2 Tax=Rhizophagus irregularis TaxID=588596 RepID=A0A2N1MXP3_9GLOM|nr:hypothetical protein RhiirC2_784781 [Rhizophagus irregularis]